MSQEFAFWHYPHEDTGGAQINGQFPLYDRGHIAEVPDAATRSRWAASSKASLILFFDPTTPGPIGASVANTGNFTTLTGDLIRADANGSAAAPAYTRATDLNTGIFFPTADTLAVTTNGVERTRWDSAGRQMWGTTVVQALLTAQATSAAGLYVLGNGDGNPGIIVGSHVAGTTSDIAFTANAVLGVESSLTVAMEAGGEFRIATGATDAKTGRAGATTAFTFGANGLGIGAAPTANSKLRITGLPTSSTGLVSGEAWLNSGVLTVV